MPEKYCGPCGIIHLGLVDELCTIARESLAGRITRSTKTKMAAGGDEADGTRSRSGVKLESTDDLISEDLRDMHITCEEDELRKEIAQLEYKRRMEDLYARKAELLAPRSPPRLGRETERHSRRHRASRKHRSSSGSSSGSRTPSETRKKRSKWSIKRYTTDKKLVKKLTPPELIEASCLWMIDQKNLVVPDYVAFIKHISYIAGKDKCDKFNDSAHVNYDTAVRKVAEEEGFKAFRRGDPELSIVHFSIENFKVKSTPRQASRTASRQGGYSKEGKRPCYKWNRDTGCDDTACEFGHHCAKCGSKNHKKIKCSRD